MPQKKTMKRKFAKDKKQDNRLKKLESFVYKTIENKQVDYVQDLSISSAGTETYPLLRVSQGVRDGDVVGDPARIGSNITLMKERCDMNFLAGDSYNQIRVLIVESMDGNQNLDISDVLEYSNYAITGDRVFVSPYTTKTSTNRRYKVHMDKCFELNVNSKATKQIHWKKNYKNGKVIEFNDNASDVPTSRQQHIFILSDSTSAIHPTCKYVWRSTFKDA